MINCDLKAYINNCVLRNNGSLDSNITNNPILEFKDLTKKNLQWIGENCRFKLYKITSK